MNGGTSTVASYGLVDSDAGKRINIPPGHLDFFRSLIPYYETEDYIFVHAGLKPGVPLDQTGPDGHDLDKGGIHRFRIPISAKK